MPSYHRVGVDIPGAMNQLGQYGQQLLGGLQQPQQSMYLPLTPQAIAMLLQLFQQVLASAAGGGYVIRERSMNPDEMDSFAAPGEAAFAPNFSDEFKPRIVTTTPKPATSSVVVKPKLSTTVSLSSPQQSLSALRAALPFNANATLR